MNRQIKFRGKTEEGIWLIGNLLQWKYGTTKILFENENEIMDIFEVIPESVGQFTGNQSQGLDVFEGDIFEDVMSTEEKGVVKFGEYNHCFDDNVVKKFGNHFGFYVEFKNERIRKDLAYWCNHSKLIGNITDNPELLKT